MDLLDLLRGWNLWRLFRLLRFCVWIMLLLSKNLWLTINHIKWEIWIVVQDFIEGLWVQGIKMLLCLLLKNKWKRFITMTSCMAKYFREKRRKFKQVQKRKRLRKRYQKKTSLGNSSFGLLQFFRGKILVI